MRGVVINDRRGFRVDTSLPLVEVLTHLAHTKPEWPSEQYLRRFMGGRSQVPVEADAQWYRKAWWGWYAARIIYRYVIEGRHEEVADLVDPVDMSSLRAALEKSRGVVMVGNHLGPYPAIDAVRRRFPDLNLLVLTSNEARKGPGMLVLSTPEQQKLALARSLLHLRRNGIVRIAPDGRIAGETAFYFDFLGQRIRMARGTGELIYLSGAEALWCSASWTDFHRIRIDMSPFNMGQGESKLDTLSKWYIDYLGRLRRQMYLAPQDIGFRSGHILSHRGRLRYPQASPDSTSPQAEP